MAETTIDAIDAALNTGSLEDPMGLLAPTEGPDDEPTEGPDEETEGLEDDPETGDLSASARARFEAILKNPRALAAFTEMANAQSAKTKSGNPARKVEPVHMVKIAKPRAIRPRLSRTTRPTAARPGALPTARIVEARRQMAANFMKYAQGRPVVMEDGTYWATGELIFTGEKHSNDRGSLLAKADTTATFFLESIGDTTTRLGVTHAVTISDTNVRTQGKQVMTEQVMLIEKIKLEVIGVRVRYAAADVTAAIASAAIKDILGGKGYLFDDRGIYFPTEIYRDQDGYNELERALLNAANVRFHRAEHAAGGNEDSRTALIDSYGNCKGPSKLLATTTGGADTMEQWVGPQGLREGFYWNLDLTKPDASEFKATIAVDQPTAIICTPVDLGSGTPVMPEAVSLELRMTLQGVTIRPANSQMISLRKK